MKIRPEVRCATLGFAAVAIAVVSAGCGMYVKRAPAPPASDRAQTFLQARAEPLPLAAMAPDGPNGTPTVDVAGAVAHPGTLQIEPAVETLRQAIDAAGGIVSPGQVLRIRAGDDAAAKLFAHDGANEAVVEIPVAALDGPPIYLRPGDVIDVGAAEASQQAALTNPPPPSPAPAAAPEPVKAPEASKLLAPIANSTAVANPTSAILPETKPAEPAKPASAEEANLRAELAALRTDMEGRLATLRADVERLQKEQARLSTNLDRPIQSSRAALSASPTAPTKPAAAAMAAKVDAAPKAPEKPAVKSETEAGKPSASRLATVLVSGSVRKPGSYPIDDVKTVGGAVHAAGDRTDANLEAVEVRADGQRGALAGMGLGLGAAPAKTVVNLVAIEAGKSGDVPLRGGEVIFVPASRSGERR